MILTRIELLDSYSEEQQLMHLTFDEGKDTAYIIWSHANLIQYLNDEVVATFRTDMYNGRAEKFVNTLARVGVIHTLEKENNVKLYVDVTDNHSNVRFKEIEDGGTAVDAVVYVVDMRFDSSARAEWVDLTVMDQARKLAQLRIFSPDNKTAALKGRYVMGTIRRTKYGLSAESVITVDSAFPYSPEVEISERFILDAFAEDSEMLNLLSATNFVTFAKKHVDLEPGYVLVRLALELDIASELNNLMREVDTALIKRALLLEKFFVFQEESPFTSEIINFVKISQQNFRGKNDVLLLLFGTGTEYAEEKLMLHTIKDTVNTVIKVKKGVTI